MHLFLSPHLDDGILSCGATIHQLTAQGEDVTILTIMAGDPPNPLPDTPIIADLHQRWQAGYEPVKVRRAEDERACAQLGAAAIHWMLGDCVYRVAQQNGTTIALYPSEDSLWGPVHPDDPAPTFLRNSALPPCTHLYVPLGSRHHVDHRIVRDWGLSLHHPALLLYEEYPYEIDATMELERALDYFAPRKLERLARPVSEADVAGKVQAIACYESQISTFWPGLPEMERQTRDSMLAAGNGSYVERFWRIT
jgi:LmbE family N-acetylglucosaminyl deacetylase